MWFVTATMKPTIIRCNGCNQELLAKRNANKVYCESCNLHSEIPIGGQLSHDQKLRSCWMRNKMQGGTTNTTTPSLNYMPSPTSFPNVRSKKRALLCGVSYKDWKYKLKGTINDVKNMKELLIKKFGYPEECIRVLTEEETNPQFIPTKANILYFMNWLVESCQPGDSLVFYYSGHGLRQPDFENDERDGFDETLCPVDFRKEGMILDNEINSTIVSPLKEGVTLHAIVDACHSGTILDLSHVYNIKEKKWEDNSPPSGVRKCTSGGLAISISACEDHQMATDTSAYTKNTMNGAMTYLMVHHLQKFPGLTYGNYLDLIHERMEENRCFPNSKILRKVLPTRLQQKPLISSSKPFDVYMKQFTL